MAREITERQLRNESEEVMRALDVGESFVVTRNGVAVGELTRFDVGDSSTVKLRSLPAPTPRRSMLRAYAPISIV